MLVLGLGFAIRNVEIERPTRYAATRPGCARTLVEHVRSDRVPMAEYDLEHATLATGIVVPEYRGRLKHVSGAGAVGRLDTLRRNLAPNPMPN